MGVIFSRLGVLKSVSFSVLQDNIQGSYDKCWLSLAYAFLCKPDHLLEMLLFGCLDCNNVVLVLCVIGI